MLDAAYEGAFYTGVVCCHSVWMCPVCAAKIAARRVEEVRRVVEYAGQVEGTVVMTTHTLRHHHDDPISQVERTGAEALERLQRGSPFARLRERLGIVGRVRSVEVTHGRNGWHVHYHILWFSWQKWGCEEQHVFAEYMRAAWPRAVARAGGYCDEEHGCVVSMGHDEDVLSSYVVKCAASWGLEGEMAGGQVKQGRNGNRTLFQLLYDATFERDTYAALLWRDAVLHLKGKRMLDFAQGLRQWVGLNAEQSDEELGAEEQEGAQEVVTLSEKAYDLIVRLQLEALVLEWAEVGGGVYVLKMLRASGVDTSGCLLPDKPD
ncbi:MAG: protein rep [Chloroflexaceae bacterium]|nr:protein rep [Chloroflexaceae bacterium]